MMGFVIFINGVLQSRFATSCLLSSPMRAYASLPSEVENSKDKSALSSSFIRTIIPSCTDTNL